MLLAESRGATHTNLDPLRLFLANETPLVPILWNLLKAGGSHHLRDAHPGMAPMGVQLHVTACDLNVCVQHSPCEHWQHFLASVCPASRGQYTMHCCVSLPQNLDHNSAADGGFLCGDLQTLGASL